MRATHVVLVLACSVLYLVLVLFGGRSSMNEGLGPDGPVYSAMVISHDMRAGSAPDKLSPAFPLAAAIAYAIAGNARISFLVVNVIAFGVLVWAMCWTLSRQQAPVSLHVAAALTLVLLGIPTRTTAFAPGQPYLLAVAAISLAVAAADRSVGWVAAVLQIAGVAASPAGIIAPLFGIWRHWRRERIAVIAAVFSPALAVWVLVQYWARGGLSGLVDLVRVSRVRADAAFWAESVFILFGVYFLVTVLGGFTLLVASSPRWLRSVVSRQPELLALLIPLVPFIATAGLDVPREMVFLLPFSFAVIAIWGRDHSGSSIVVPLMLVTALTVLTQHPWARLNDVNYFVDWFPYSVYGRRVDVADAGFDTTWRLRIFIAAAGLAACAMWWRSMRRAPAGNSEAR